MPNPDARIVAVIDIGSTSIHLLVGRRGDDTGCSFEPLADASEALGLGERVDATGELGSIGTEALVATLERQLAEASALGASAYAVIATEPLRSARDAVAATATVLDRLGLPLRVLTPAEEALCALVGVTEGQIPARETAVLDVGGGSTELVRAGPRRDPRPFSMPIGAIRLSSTVVAHNPPTAGEMEALRRTAGEAVRTAPRWVLASLVAVGGTATNLAKVAAWTRGSTEVGESLSIDDISRVVVHLGGMPADAVATEAGIRPGRARILPAGAAILEAVLNHYDLPAADVSTASLREGLVRLLCMAGERWQDRLPELARGWY